MEIWMIWATDPADPAETVWLVTAWDADSVSESYDGWLEEIAKAENEYGGSRHIRIAKTTVNLEAIQNSFKPVTA